MAVYSVELRGVHMCASSSSLLLNLLSSNAHGTERLYFDKKNIFYNKRLKYFLILGLKSQEIDFILLNTYQLIAQQEHVKNQVFY